MVCVHNYGLLFNNSEHLLMLFPLISSHMMASFSSTLMTTSGKMLGWMTTLCTLQRGYQMTRSGMVSSCNLKLTSEMRRRLD
jgi:hypothetical protein